MDRCGRRGEEREQQENDDAKQRNRRDAARSSKRAGLESAAACAQAQRTLRLGKAKRAAA